MYERLTRRISDGTAVFAEKSKSFYSAQIYEEARDKNRQLLDRLCELEDKIEQGLLAELEQNALTREELQRILWGIIGREGIEITNQNIDWLLEMVYKEKGGAENG